LEDERRSRFELADDPSDVGRPAERRRPPGNALRVRAEIELLARLDEAKGGVTKSSRAEKPLDVGN
jgi:hypothetical protein